LVFRAEKIHCLLRGVREGASRDSCSPIRRALTSTEARVLRESEIRLRRARQGLSDRMAPLSLQSWMRSVSRKGRSSRRRRNSNIGRDPRPEEIDHDPGEEAQADALRRAALRSLSRSSPGGSRTLGVSVRFNESPSRRRVLHSDNERQCLIGHHGLWVTHTDAGEAGTTAWQEKRQAGATRDPLECRGWVSAEGWVAGSENGRFRGRGKSGDSCYSFSCLRPALTVR